ncbi:MAG: ATP-binding protein, partial [Chitinophagaceae bacterium]
MPLPININDLINGTTVEWERIEFKEGWNDLNILHTICAFANDFSNLGGGYVIIGVAEKDGKPILPPKGLTAEQADKIQKDLLNLCKQRLKPDYTPIVEPVTFQDKLIL